MQAESHGTGTTRSLGFWAVVATQFLTAFVDNAFRVGIMVLAFTLPSVAEKAGHKVEVAEAATVSSISTILMLLPYAFLSLLAGIISDRISKRTVFIVCKAAELPLMALGMYGLVGAYHAAEAGTSPQLSLFIVLAAIFFLGTQVAFVSPTRYGILPEILTTEELTVGNGYLELGSFAGIFAGMLSAGYIVHGLDAKSPYGWTVYLVPLASLLGVCTSFLIPKVKPANPTLPLAPGLDWRRFFHNWKVLQSRPGLVPSVLGTTLFWSVSTLVTLNALNAASRNLGVSDNPIDSNSLTIATSIGLAIGCFAAGRLSIGVIELGLVPFGALLWVVAFVGLMASSLLGTHPNEAGVLVEYYWPTAAMLALSGFAAGLFVVPLNAYLEHNSPPEERASCIATGNILQVLGMMAAAAISGVVCAFVKGWYAPKILWLIGAVVLGGCSIYIFRLLPAFFVRFTIMLLTRIVYRVRVFGLENVPTEGPALVVMNHTSFMDGVLVLASIKRPTKFIVYRTHYESPYLNWLAKAAGAIPIDSEGSPKEIIASLRTATDALNRGEVVGIFAEGGISRTGVIMPFQRGMEMILRRAKNVPIVPGFIDGMWGSVFSYSRGKVFWKRPTRWPYPVTIKFGEPMPADSTAFQVRSRVQLLSADCYELRRKGAYNLPRKFLNAAWKYGKRPCVADTMRKLNYGETLKAATALSGVVGRKVGEDQMIGVLAPPSVGGALANLAVSFLGKTPVNLNYTTGIDVMNRCIKQAGLKKVLASRAFLEKVKLEPDAELIYLEDLREQIEKGDKYKAAAAWLLPPWIASRTVLRAANQKPDDLATIIFSSGSTGDPKGVMLTQHNIVSNVQGVVQMIGADERDCLMGVLPFFHSFGYTGTLWLPWYIGGSVVYHYSPLEADVVGKLIHEYKATIFMTTATFLRNHLRKNEPEELQSLRMIVCGAEKLPMQLSDQFEKKFGFRPYEGYGCTELSPVVSCNRPDVVEKSYKQVCRKEGTIGHPLPGVAVKIADPESWKELPLGEEGLLLVRGPNVMKGYLNKPEMTADAIRDGWYSTGDIAKLDEDGFITITDRLSRFSKIGGEMVPHAKVEDQLHDIVGTTDRMFVVVGIPDPRKGERLAVIHTKLPLAVDELWEKLRERGLPPLWVPAKAAFHEVPEIPVLGTGKVDLKGAKALAPTRE